MNALVRTSVFALLVVGCRERDPEVASLTSGLPIARYALGLPAAYEAEALTPFDLETLRASLPERRGRAWKVIAKTVAPHKLAELSDLEVPVFTTWYDAGEIARMFDKLYAGLPSAERKTHQAFTAADVDAVEAWNAQAVTEFPHWSPEAIAKWLEQIDAERAAGLAGLARILYSPGFARHVLIHYRAVAACAHAGTPCQVPEFPPDALAVKTAWQRADLDTQVTVHPTDPVSLQALFGKTEWEELPSGFDPHSPLIHQIRLESGAKFRLKAMHVMSKEAKDWLWTTLWWSDQPLSDFGEDRSPDIDSLWANYKMCVVVDDEETGSVPADFAETHATLAASLNALTPKTDGYTWCSNPNLELGQGNHVSNCIGCHQHAGTQTTNEEILANETTFPGKGRKVFRETFPTDYVWSLARGTDNLGERLTNIIEYYDAPVATNL